MADDKRTETREDAELALRLASGASGTTHDVSKSGIYFECDADQTVGSVIDILIDFETAGGPMLLQCHGQVVRTELQGNRIGIAVKILESKFQPRHSGFGSL